MRTLPALIGVLLMLSMVQAHAADDALPEGFVRADQTVPGLVLDLRYAGADNFVGQRIDGYEAVHVVLTAQAAEALGKVQADLLPFGLGLKVFDAYRPARAVAHFVRWSSMPDDPATKRAYYPDIDKQKLFEEGYVATRSSHSRGSTLDLTLVSIDRDGAARELDMGTPFDFFGPESWPDYAALTGEQRSNRLLLKLVMERHGFKPFDKEWWHFTLGNEPFPETYFDFPIR
ncbi:M15 family metallopeptidase [Emcibacter sp. SYSU 3D8]|uniref:M15 family metallopeptidase n=1 Tax=Emcibacter sp. SYSU 3D8 TaxID=3133969 RepID=UPI0031FE742A